MAATVITRFENWNTGRIMMAWSTHPSVWHPDSQDQPTPVAFVANTVCVCVCVRPITTANSVAACSILKHHGSTLRRQEAVPEESRNQTARRFNQSISNDKC